MYICIAAVESETMTLIRAQFSRSVRIDSIDLFDASQCDAQRLSLTPYSAVICVRDILCAHKLPLDGWKKISAKKSVCKFYCVCYTHTHNTHSEP